MTYTIITVNYNNKNGLETTIKSVLSQTCKDYEYIIIDGGSTDGSVDVIRKYADHVAYWVSEPDNGIYQAMNKGIAKAKGEYLNFMNSGDCFYHEHVLQQMQDKLDCDITEGSVYDSSTKQFSYKSTSNPTMLFFYRGGLGHQACFIRRELLKETPYDENLRLASDWKFFVEKIIFDNCSYRFVDIPIVTFEGNGASTKNMSLYEKERQLLLEELFPPRILSDFERFHDKESPIIDLIPAFNKTKGLQRTIILFAQIAIKFHNFLRR